MDWFEDIQQRRIRLTCERREHIENDHPEMHGQLDKIRQTLQNPDQVVLSRADSKIELYYAFYPSTPVTRKHLCVVVKGANADRFIVTAYFTDSVRKGTVLWEKK